MTRKAQATVRKKIGVPGQLDGAEPARPALSGPPLPAAGAGRAAHRPGPEAAALAACESPAPDPAEEDDSSGADPAAERYRAPALDKGLDILEVLATRSRGLTRAELLREMGLGPSQIYRMLERLVARGYVGRIEGDRYVLTMKLFQLGTQHPPLRRLVAQAQPLMDRFAEEMRQSCHLVAPEGGAGIIVAQASPLGHWEFRARIGGRLDLFNSGSGLTLLAFQHPERRSQTLRSWGMADPEPRLAAVAEDLETVRRNGYRIGPSRQLVGVTDLSVPVLSTSHEAASVLTCAFVQRPDAPDPGADWSALGPVLERLKALAAELTLA